MFRAHASTLTSKQSTISSDLLIRILTFFRLTQLCSDLSVTLLFVKSDIAFVSFVEKNCSVDCANSRNRFLSVKATVFNFCFVVVV